MKQLLNGLTLALNQRVYAYKTEECHNPAIRTSTDSAGNHARITGVLQYPLNRAGKPNRKRALVRLSDVANGTLYAWIDAGQAKEI